MAKKTLDSREDDCELWAGSGCLAVQGCWLPPLGTQLSGTCAQAHHPAPNLAHSSLVLPEGAWWRQTAYVTTLAEHLAGACLCLVPES